MMDEEFWKQLNVPSVIAKDECLYCFETVYNETTSDQGTLHSLDLCLSCFQAVCQRHLPIHTRVSDNNDETVHSNYLCIAKVRKAEDDEDQQMDQTNKKIKLNVVEKSEDECFDIKWSLLKYDLSTSSQTTSFSDRDSNIPAIMSEKIRQILGSKSQELVDKTSSWELSISSCPHTKDFKVVDSEPKTIADTCNDCQLAQNLWVCLHCGNVGCGREQVGIEGHSHALKHFEGNPSHALAVKLGSLSQSSADIYCYSCNDEVKFDDNKQLGQALSRFGIDLDNKMASEKSLVELQVEQNMNWDFRMVDAKGNDLKRLPVGKQYGCGLINLGNSCYLNSVLQCLLNGGVKDYSWGQVGQAFPLDVLYPGTNLRCQLIKINNALEIEPELYANGIRPRSFKKCIGQGHEEFSSERQQDALEFLTYLIDKLDQKIFTGVVHNPNNLMKFVMQDKLQCNKCKKVRYSSEPCKAIQIPLKESDNPDNSQHLLERLQAYFSGETLEFRCPECNETGTATRTPGFQTFPDTLVINPVRLKLVNWTPVKTNDDLEIPGLSDLSDTLDLSSFQSRGFDPETEVMLRDTDEDRTDEFVPNPTCVSQLVEMGFTPNAIAKALHASGNVETEPAMNWLFEHMDDPDLDVPLTLSKKAAHVPNQVDQESLDNMTAMGLDPKLCRKALILHNGDVSRSVEWVFCHMDDDGELPRGTAPDTEAETHGHPTPAPYKLVAIVCHKGNSAHSGHYVAFIRKYVDQEEKWVLYNDEKIVVAVEDNFEEMRKNGYLYFYSRF
ncbi:hypothetical protein HG536_0C03390 [Torulaspora globosa]|uniref:Ubiquitin carboxyl-terminal hydrolase n=1 Tax=Torulaspora globosa TaxID=48254 RepID=A0A7G3ZF85_9SACH|nr:uncharacterized protein HG536_0C03390 [Torulaspora globosa]QLL32171.1 hypothetical protein HG536_0C03390 [Torulaspora globosa]